MQYIDHGCIERIPQCHLYPTTLYTGIPPFCIPCQLYKTVPVSNGKFEDILVVTQIDTLFSHTKVETSCWYFFLLMRIVSQGRLLSGTARLLYEVTMLQKELLLE